MINTIVTSLRLLINNRRVSMTKSSARDILSGKPDWATVQQQAAKGHPLSRAPVKALTVREHGMSLFQQALYFLVGFEILGNTGQTFGKNVIVCSRHTCFTATRPSFLAFLQSLPSPFQPVCFIGLKAF